MPPGLTPFTLVLSFFLSLGWPYNASTQLATSLPSVAQGVYPTERTILLDFQKHTNTHACEAQTSNFVFGYRGSDCERVATEECAEDVEVLGTKGRTI